MLRFTCPGCHKRLQLASVRPGAVIGCPSCKHRLRLQVSVLAESAGAKLPEVLPVEEAAGEEPVAVALPADGSPSAAAARSGRPPRPAPAAPAVAVPAEAGRLGTLLAEFGPNLRKLRGDRFFALLLLAAGCLVVLFGPPLALRLTPPERVGGVLLGLLVVIVAAVVGGVAYLLEARHFRSQRVLVFERGLLRVTRRGTPCWPWEEIAAFRQRMTERRRGDVYVPVTQTYTIQRHGGETIVLDDYLEDVVELGELIQERLREHMLPGALQACTAGREINFGEISVSEVGVHRGKKTLAWRDCAGFAVTDGRLILRKRGAMFPWYSAAVQSLPNFFLLRALVDRLRQD
jgi:hypothetical protein